MNFNKEIFIKNIYFLAKENNIRIGDLEKEASVSAGYFSRLLNNSNTISIGIDIVLFISKKFNIRIDELINSKLFEMSKNELNMCRILYSLIKNTRNGMYKWESILKNNAKTYLSSNKKLIPLSVDYIEGNFCQFKYYSVFLDNKLDVNYDICYVDFENNKKIIISKFDDMNIGFKSIFFELVIEINGEIKKICTDNNCDNLHIHNLLNDLYVAAIAAVHEPKLDKDVEEFLSNIITCKI